MLSLKSIAVPITRKVVTKKAKGRTKNATDARDVEVSEHAVLTPQRRQAPTVVPHATHRYRVGERLCMTNGGRSLSRLAAGCVIIARLPYEGRGHLMYRVRSDTEQYERVVAEMDLSRPEPMEP
jgi:hypothetical protein